MQEQCAAVVESGTPYSACVPIGDNEPWIRNPYNIRMRPSTTRLYYKHINRTLYSNATIFFFFCIIIIFCIILLSYARAARLFHVFSCKNNRKNKTLNRVVCLAAGCPQKDVFHNALVVTADIIL
jgi:hypothetical protein